MAQLSRRVMAAGCLIVLSFGLLLGSLIAQDVDEREAERIEAERRKALLDRSPLPVQPKTVPELFEAAGLMVDLGRPQLAKLYLTLMLEQKPDDEALLNLRLKFGPGDFMKLAKVEALQPISSDLLENVNRLMAARATDPERIAKLVEDLRGSREQELLATEELKNSGPEIIPALLNILLKHPGPETERDILQIMAQMGHRVEPPLVAALEIPDDDVRAGVISVLGHVGNRETLDDLWYYANAPKVAAGVKTAAHEAIAQIAKMDPNRLGSSPVESVVNELRRLAVLHARGLYQWKTDQDGNVSIWLWKREAESVVLTKMRPQVASNLIGSKFARQALSIAPEKRDIQVLFLSMTLAAEGMLAGWERPLPTGPGTAHDLSLVAGEDVVADVLIKAMNEGQVANAVAALKVLGQIGTLRMVRSSESGRSPVLTALNYPDTRVQFAAAGAIMQLDPQDKFPGVDRVIGILARAVTGQGKPIALVIDSNLTRGSRVAGFLNELGYTPHVEETGREGFQFALDNADVELVFIHPGVVRWPLSETIANFRADSRTGSLPLILYGPNEMAGKMKRYTDNNPLFTYFTASASTEGLQLQLSEFLQTLKSPPLGEDQRAYQAEVASYWLAHIAEGQRTKIYNLNLAENALLVSADNPALAENCLLALGSIGTRGSQAKMAELLLNLGLDNRLRVTAAGQLAYHIQRHGLVLDDTQLADIQQLWKAPGDPALSTAVGAVIGSLRPNARLVGERLQEFDERSTLDQIQP